MMTIRMGETSTKLENLPKDIQKFPDPLADKIRYDIKAKQLVFKGYMSTENKVALLELSRDENYKRSIDVLFQESRAVRGWPDINKLPTEDDKIKAASELIRKDAADMNLTEEELLKKIGRRVGIPPKDIPTEAEMRKILSELVRKGLKPSFGRTAAGTSKTEVTPIPSVQSIPRIMLMETYTLTSFLGDYGVGRTVKTFSLLPSEKTKISIKTWKTTETTTKQASSILDSWTRDTSDAFESSVQSENTNREEAKESNEWYIDAEVKGHYGAGAWGVEGTVKGGTKNSSNNARENLAKNVTNATEKHVANASSKRNVEVNTSFEAKAVTGEEQSIVRELENINAGRVLNFVFRQLNQEYITYLHLIDVRLAFTDGLGPNTLESPNHYKEFALNQIENFIDYYIRDKKSGEQVDPKDEVRRIVVEELSNIYDYKGVKHEFIECIDLSTGKPENASGEPIYVSDYFDRNKRLNNQQKLMLYLRVKRNPFYQNKYTSPDDIPDDATENRSYEKHIVPGIILAKNTYILPTDSVIIEALLGQAEALDKYSMDSRKAVIDTKRAEIDKMRLANTIIESEDDKKADLFAKVYPAPPK